MIFERAFALSTGIKPVQVVRNGTLSGSNLARAVIALGNFDGFHLGHQLLLQKAKQIAGTIRPIAVMSVEPHSRQFFNPDIVIARLALPEQKRRLAEMLGLDYIFEPDFDQDFASLTPEAFVIDILHRRLDISHIIVGENFRFGAGRRGNCASLIKLASSVGIGVDIIPLQTAFSSTHIRKALQDGNVKSACQSLGRAWEASIVWRDNGYHLAEGLVCPKEGYYVLADPSDGRVFISQLAQDGRIWSTVSCPGRVSFLARLER